MPITPGLPATVLVQWEHSARAINHRVSWKPQVSSGAPTVVGLYGDGEATLSGLPSGVLNDALVTGRKRRGNSTHAGEHPRPVTHPALRVDDPPRADCPHLAPGAKRAGRVFFSAKRQGNAVI